MPIVLLLLRGKKQQNMNCLNLLFHFALELEMQSLSKAAAGFLISKQTSKSTNYGHESLGYCTEN
jgi:hypothetical protein